jgi:hypothetical protein
VEYFKSRFTKGQAFRLIFAFWQKQLKGKQKYDRNKGFRKAISK